VQLNFISPFRRQSESDRCDLLNLATMTEAVEKNAIRGPIIALDLGTKRVGIAVSDALSISIRRLDALPRTNWKQLLRDVDNAVHSFDAQTVVIGLPLRLNGSQGDAAFEARRMAEKFARSLKVPVYLQDERLTSAEAEQNLRLAGHQSDEIAKLVDSESAAMILTDFLSDEQHRILVPNS
jgi:putative holliday junction resolvase